MGRKQGGVAGEGRCPWSRIPTPSALARPALRPRPHPETAASLQTIQCGEEPSTSSTVTSSSAGNRSPQAELLALTPATYHLSTAQLRATSPHRAAADRAESQLVSLALQPEPSAASQTVAPVLPVTWMRDRAMPAPPHRRHEVKAVISCLYVRPNKSS